MVVYIFLQSFRATIIPMLTVPVSLLGAFIMFPALGFSVNTLTCSAWCWPSASWWTTPSWWSRRCSTTSSTAGPGRGDAQAMKEVSGPVVAIALVLCAVFVPVAFMGGVTGQLYKQFALTIAVAVVFSAINALTLSPALCAILLKKPTPARGPLGVLRAVQSWI